MSDISLYSAALCPFAHRARLALAEKGLAARQIEIDLRNKPADFLEISPQGKVPVLCHRDAVVWESSVIGEYLEDAFPSLPLLPPDPALRAQARIWTVYADTQLYAASGRLIHSTDPQVQEASRTQLTQILTYLNQHALAHWSEQQPYWLGAQYSLADIAFYPWFEQLCALEAYRAFHIPTGCNKLMRWRAAVEQRPAVQAIAQSPAFYLDRYGALLR